MRRLCVLIPLLATGCNSLSKSVFALNLYQNGSHLHVDVVPTSGCADVSRLADVTLGLGQCGAEPSGVGALQQGAQAPV